MQKPTFVAIVRNGTLSCIYMLNGNQDVHYLLIDEDALSEDFTDEEYELFEEGKNEDDIIRNRLNTDPDQFLQVVDGAVNSPADLYQPGTVH